MHVHPEVMVEAIPYFIALSWALGLLTAWALTYKAMKT